MLVEECSDYLAGVVVREMQLSILRGDSRKQKRPPLLANAVMVVGPVGWSGLHQTGLPALIKHSATMLHSTRGKAN